MRFSPRSVFLGAMALVASVALGWAVNITGTNTSNQNSTFAVGFLDVSALNGITAAVGGGQTNAVQLQDSINRVTVVATAADSVKLPPAKQGLVVFVANSDAADAMGVFPFLGDAINALGPNTVLSVAANKGVMFFCPVDGLWISILTA